MKVMKKVYKVPAIKVVRTQPAMPLATSDVKSDNGIDYGGVDTEGEKDPDVKENFFDFEW